MSNKTIERWYTVSRTSEGADQNHFFASSNFETACKACHLVNEKRGIVGYCQVVSTVLINGKLV